MSLTKQQIDYIENRLIKEGVKYWDIRIELLDHIVSDVESKLQKEDDFERLVQNSFIGLGWNGSFEKEIKERRSLINRKYRKKYQIEFVHFFKSVKNIILFIVFFLFYYYLFTTLNENNFKRISILIPLFSTLLYLIIVIVNYLKKREKTLQLEYGMAYLSMTFLIFNSTPQYIDAVYSLLFIPFYLVLTYAGYKTYMKAKNEIEKMYKELQKL